MDPKLRKKHHTEIKNCTVTTAMKHQPKTSSWGFCVSSRWIPRRTVAHSFGLQCTESTTFLSRREEYWIVTHKIWVIVTKRMLLLNDCPQVNTFAGLNNERSLITIYHYKQKHWLFYFACVQLKNYFHKNSDFGKLILLICWNNWLSWVPPVHLKPPPICYSGSPSEKSLSFSY